MSMLKDTNKIYKYDIPVGVRWWNRSLRAKPEGNHPPERIHSIMLPPFGCHVCFIIPNNLPSQLVGYFTFFSKLRHLRMLCSLSLFPTLLLMAAFCSGRDLRMSYNNRIYCCWNHVHVWCSHCWGRRCHHCLVSTTALNAKPQLANHA